MRARMAENPNTIGEDTTDVAGWRFDTISPDHNFYFNDEGKIVIPFDEYEVRPGSTGSRNLFWNPRRYTTIFCIGRKNM